MGRSLLLGRGLRDTKSGKEGRKYEMRKNEDSLSPPAKDKDRAFFTEYYYDSRKGMSTTHVRLMKWYEGSLNENSLPLARLPFYARLDLMARRSIHVAQCTVRTHSP